MLPETLVAWLSLLETRHPFSIELGLERVQAVADRLLGAFPVPVITVAGTNGKGSVVATVQQLALDAGLRTGVYTSPHLLRFNERVALNGRFASDTELINAFAAVEQARGAVSLTYFEFTTLAALWLFQQEPLDLVVLEVGMGGRLDAVNIVEPAVTVLTTVDFDHTSYLGDSLAAIAREKAGICRQGVPAVLADAGKMPLLEAAAGERHAVPVRAGQEYQFSVDSNEFCYRFGTVSLRCPLPKLDADLIAAGLTAFLLACPGAADAEGPCPSLASAALPGRWQCLEPRPGSVPTYLDIGHNPQASRRLREKALQTSGHRWHLVVGLLGDKDAEGVLAPWRGQNVRWYCCDLPGPRSGKAAMLTDVLGQDAEVNAYADPVSAWRAAQLAASAGENILVFGSFLTVAAVLQAWQAER